MVQVQKQWKNVVVLEYIRLDITFTAIYIYLDGENYKILKFHMNNLRNFGTSASFF